MDYRDFCRLGPMACVMLVTYRTCDECLHCDKDAYIAALRTQLAELKEKNEEWEQTFDLTYKADVRGIEMFRKAHPEYAEQLKMPSTDKLICWLIEQLAEKEREITDLKSLTEYFAGRLNSLVEALSARDSELAETKAELELAETVHATVSDELALYQKAVEPVKECLVNCKIAMEYALKYLDGIGLSAANDLKEAIEEITRTQDCIRILGDCSPKAESGKG